MVEKRVTGNPRSLPKIDNPNGPRALLIPIIVPHSRLALTIPVGYIFSGNGWDR